MQSDLYLGGIGPSSMTIDLAIGQASDGEDYSCPNRPPRSGEDSPVRLAMLYVISV